MMRLLTTLLLAAACTACGGPSQDGNAFTFDEAGMAYRVEFRTENTVRILARPAGSPLVTRAAGRGFAACGSRRDSP